MQTKLETPAPRLPIMPAVQYVIVAIGLVIAVGVWLMVSVMQALKEDQDQGIIRGYKNRAVTCDMIRGLGIQEPQNCREDVIQPFRDHELKPGSTAGARSSAVTKEVVCIIIRNMVDEQGRPIYVPDMLCPK